MGSSLFGTSSFGALQWGLDYRDTQALPHLPPDTDHIRILKRVRVESMDLMQFCEAQRHDVRKTPFDELLIAGPVKARIGGFRIGGKI